MESFDLLRTPPTASHDREEVVPITSRHFNAGTQLARALERSVCNGPCKVVWDRTGLSGSYYFGLRFDRNFGLNTDATAYPTLENALQDHGREFKKQKGPAEKVIVEYIEAPSQD